ncbi:hypothetical protein N2152v2_001798 [Parachlorella kessleri]
MATAHATNGVSSTATEAKPVPYTNGSAPRNGSASPGSDASLAFKLTTNLLWVFEKGVAWASGLDKEREASPYLRGNYAPVSDEIFQDQLEVVEGKLPAVLNGAFLRNGPNPAVPMAGGYHWFDGDGMVHAVRIKDGKASYCNRFVETARLHQERKAGYGVFGRFGDSKGKAGLVHMVLRILKERLGIITPSKVGRGTGNTALAYHAEKVLALHEGDLPYVLRVACEGVLETLGRWGFEGRLDHPFTAHPKIDPKTGELFFIGYDLNRKPYLYYSLADKEGNLVHDYPVGIPDPVMMHDFAITQDYAIFMDCPLVLKPERMVKEGKLPFIFDKSRPARFGVLPRYAKDAAGIKWFETEPMIILHVVNAWQEGDKVKLFGCAFKEFDLDGFTADCGDEDLAHVTEICMDLATGTATSRRVAPLAGDFPVVHPSLVGRKTRYCYIGHMRNTSLGYPEFIGVAKLDLLAQDPSKAVAGLILFGGHKFGGEAYFAPSGGQAEDDGHLLVFVHDEDAGVTELVVYNAKSMSEEPVARVRMPRRVPYGFHSLWISEAQLQAQAKSKAGLAAVAVPGKGAQGGLLSRTVAGNVA